MNNCILTHVFWWIVANSGSGSETLKWWPAFANALKYGTGFSVGITDIWVFVLYWETSIKESLIYRLFLPSVKSCTAVVVCREQEHLGKLPELVFAILNSLSFLLILSSSPFAHSILHSVTSSQSQAPSSLCLRTTRSCAILMKNLLMRKCNRKSSPLQNRWPHLELILKPMEAGLQK